MGNAAGARMDGEPATAISGREGLDGSVGSVFVKCKSGLGGKGDGGWGT